MGNGPNLETFGCELKNHGMAVSLEKIYCVESTCWKNEYSSTSKIVHVCFSVISHFLGTLWGAFVVAETSPPSELK